MTYSECEGWLATVGMATVLPGKAALWPCMLWEAQGHRGPFSGWDEAFQNVWNWKDELPARGRAWAGHLLGSQVMLVHVNLLPVFLGARGPLEVEELYEEGGLSQPAVQVYRYLSKAAGAVGRAQLRAALGLSAPIFDKACRDLERLLVITRCGTVTEGPGWGANAYALVDRHFAGATSMPHREARVMLRETLQRTAPEAKEAQLRRWCRDLGG